MSRGAICAVKGCNKPTHSGGRLCSMHNERRRRSGSVDLFVPTPVQRIYANVVIDGSTGCWNWTKSTNPGGYGFFRMNHKTFLAHRVAYELLVGPIPEGLCACHHCDNPRCVNPAHLFIGTRADNNYDSIKKGRRHSRG